MSELTPLGVPLDAEMADVKPHIDAPKRFEVKKVRFRPR